MTRVRQCRISLRAIHPISSRRDPYDTTGNVWSIREKWRSWVRDVAKCGRGGGAPNKTRVFSLLFCFPGQDSITYRVADKDIGKVDFDKPKQTFNLTEEWPLERQVTREFPDKIIVLVSCEALEYNTHLAVVIRSVGNVDNSKQTVSYLLYCNSFEVV
jgi:hypothetical protein